VPCLDTNIYAIIFGFITPIRLNVNPAYLCDAIFIEDISYKSGTE